MVLIVFLLFRNSLFFVILFLFGMIIIFIGFFFVILVLVLCNWVGMMKFFWIKIGILFCGVDMVIVFLFFLLISLLDVKLNYCFFGKYIFILIFFVLRMGVIIMVGFYMNWVLMLCDLIFFGKFCIMDWIIVLLLELIL